jgi:hypothetical protein
VVNNDLKNNKKSTILTTPLSPLLAKEGGREVVEKKKSLQYFK